MLSVIVCQKSAQPFLDRYKSLLERFEEEGKIAFCFWDEHGTDASSIIPEIQNIVHGHRQWRAIVVMPLTEQEAFSQDQWRFETRLDNPYDYLMNQVFQEELKDSPIPLVKLSWVLDDVPQVTHSYEGVYPGFQDAAFSLPYQKTKTKNWYIDQQQKWQELHNRYHLRIEKPTEIYFLKARNRYSKHFPKAKDSEFLLRHEIDSSMFWFRNRYSARCRFLIHDCVQPGQSRYQEDLFSFWMSALILALSNFSSGVLEAGKVYNIHPKIDLDIIQDFYSVYYHHLRGIKESAVSEIDKAHQQGLLKRRSEKVPSFDQKIEVEFPSNEKGNMEIDLKCIGLTTDRPFDEASWLYKSVHESLAELKTTQRSIRVILDRAGRQTRFMSIISNPQVYEMDEFQYEDVHEDLVELEKSILSENTSRILPFKKTISELKRQRWRILNRMYQRMRYVGAIVCFSIGILLALIGFLPAVYYEIKMGHSFGDGILILTILCLTTILAGLLSLMYFRKQVQNRILEYNIKIQTLMGLVRSAGGFFSKYLSQCCTYMRGKSILQTIKRRSQISSARISLLSEHISHLDNQIEVTESWLSDFNMTVLPDIGDRQEVVFNFDIPPAENSGYSLQHSLLGKQIEIGDGQHMESPFPFISSIELFREPVFEVESGMYNEKTELIIDQLN